MASPYPNPDSRRNGASRPANTVDWVELPEKWDGVVPSLPYGDWSEETVAWWGRLWRKPEASQWDQSGETLWRLAKLFELLLHTDSARDASTLSAEMRQIEDRHGLSGPKSWTQLRWRRADAHPGVRPALKKAPARKRDPRLKVVPGGKGA